MAETHGEWTLVAAGDAILTRRFSVTEDDQLNALVAHIRHADVSFVNLETLLHDFEGYPAADSGGTYMRAPPWIADELAWAGFDVLAAANNHVGDFSHGGMEATMRELEARDLPYAGLGRTLADARAPAYVDTPAGRIAVVAACSSITPGSEAGEQRPDMKGRPGLSPVRLDTQYVVPETEHERLRELSAHLSLEAVKERRREQGFPIPGEEKEGLTLVNVGGDDIQFAVGESEEYRVERTPKEKDHEAVLRQIHAAERQADWVIASLHAHEGEGPFSNDESVPTWLEAFARDCVDAGADAFVGHGPHVLRGVEVYNGSPIFYSLGNFAMQNETIPRLPAELYERYDLDSSDAHPADLFDARVNDEEDEPAGFLADQTYWESVLPVCRFDDDELSEIEFHPVSLGFKFDRPRRGTPQIATDDHGMHILTRLDDLSAPYDTDIRLEGNVGFLDH